ncbi:thioesterase II family protein [Streptomyces chattanoogensis]|uniref:Thioesterase domain-containing protein n=1 Tax=Streptomyces chattanoogensis TaxID=66876 RepID=A0A0N0GUV7_9ACTN|nr:thioesterase domain-containing protein [Streptomyces chattanoogensis]KPC58672.1 hypothetical protein ADL29_38635 [Streptomyces chattanoogensis]
MCEPIADRDVELIRIAGPLQPAAFRLACFPHAVDTSESLWHLARQLLPSVEVLAVQYPHRDVRGAPGCIAGLDDLVSDSARLLRDWTDLPLALFGHRRGGEVALRVAGRLEQETDIAPLCTFVANWGAAPKFEAVRLNSPVVALGGGTDVTARPQWRACTRDRFDLEVWRGGGRFLETHCAELVNLIHDRLLSTLID